ncbi:MAG: hypothetical protein WCF18_15445 [Chthoniobacteraceae bacterium]
MIPEITPAQSAALDALGIGTIVLFSLAGGAFFGFIGAFIGHFKNRKALGLFLGIVFGPLGWLCTLFARDGEGDEGIFEAMTAILSAVLFNAIIATVSWKLIARPMIESGVAVIKENAAKEQAEHERRMAELARQNAEIEQETHPPAEPQAPDSRAWMRRGTILDRSQGVTGPQSGAGPLPERPNAPTYSGTNPAPIVVPRKPSAAEQNAEIARRYGTSQR